jgi:hypothetical protein
MSRQRVRYFNPSRGYGPVTIRPITEPIRNPILPVGNTVTFSDGTSITDTELLELIRANSRNLMRTEQRDVIKLRIKLTNGEQLSKAEMRSLKFLVSSLKLRTNTAIQVEPPEEKAERRALGRTFSAALKNKLTPEKCRILFSEDILQEVSAEVQKILQTRIPTKSFQELMDYLLISMVKKEVTDSINLEKPVKPFEFLYSKKQQETMTDGLDDGLRYLPTKLRETLKDYPVEISMNDFQEIVEAILPALSGYSEISANALKGGAPGLGKR